MALALGSRLFWVVNVSNPDGAVLAWGAALVAQGHLDPYGAAAAQPDHDPVQPDRVRPLPLAVGYGALYASGAVLAAGDHVGLIDVARDTEPGSLTRASGTIALYKLTSLLPELVMAVCVCYLFRDRRRTAALVVLALDPLAFYAYGQGLPDLWQGAVLLSTLCLVVAFQRTGRRSLAHGAIACLVVGAFAVKLMPLAVGAGLLVFLARQPPLRTAGQRAALVGVTLGSLVLGVGPYVANHLAWLSLTARFEVAMVLGANPLVAVGNVPGAPLWLLTCVGAFVWLFLVRPPDADAFVSWVALTSLVMGFASGGVQQFMLWGLVGMLLVATRSALVTGLLLVGTTAVSAYSFATFSWYDGLITRGAGPEVPVASGPGVLSALPGGQAVGPLAAGVLLVGVVLAVAIHLGHGRTRLAVAGARVGGRGLALLAATTVVALPVALLVTTVFKVDQGADTVHATDTLPAGVATAPGAISLATPVRVGIPAGIVSADGARWPARHVTLVAHPRTRPTAAEVVVVLRAGDGSLAEAAIPVNELEPRSELGPVAVALDHPVRFASGEIEITCRAPGTNVSTAACREVWLEGATTASTAAVPTLTVRSGDTGGAFAHRLVDALVRPANRWAATAAGVAGLIAMLTVRRRARLQSTGVTL